MARACVTCCLVDVRSSLLLSWGWEAGFGGAGGRGAPTEDGTDRHRATNEIVIAVAVSYRYARELVPLRERDTRVGGWRGGWRGDPEFVEYSPGRPRLPPGLRCAKPSATPVDAVLAIRTGGRNMDYLGFDGESSIIIFLISSWMIMVWTSMGVDILVLLIKIIFIGNGNYEC